MIFLLVFIALAVTLIAVEVAGASRRHSQLTAPAVLVSSGDRPSYLGLVTDPTDEGCRVASLVVASAAPLTFVGARYTVQLADDAAPIVEHGTHAEAKAALQAAGFRYTSFGITMFSPNAMLVPGREHVAFALTMHAARRLVTLEAAMDFADPAGRRITKTVSALPYGGQQLDPPITALERQPVG